MASAISPGLTDDCKEHDQKTYENVGPALTSTQSGDEIRPTLHWRTWWVLAGTLTGLNRLKSYRPARAVAVACGIILFGSNYGIAATGFWLGEVIGGLGSPELAIWFADAPLVVQVVCMPLLGLIADFGSPTKRWMTIILSLAGALGLFVAGSANTMQIGILGTAFFGFSIIAYFTCFAIVSEVFPHRMKGVAQALLYCLTAGGGFVGDLGGGATVKSNVGGAGGWRWNLYLSGIFHVVGAAVLLLCYRPLPVHNETSYVARLKKLDFVGCLLFATGWCLLLVALVSGGNTHPWKSAMPIACLLIGAVFFGAFVAHQVFWKKDGVFHHELFGNRNFAMAAFAVAVEGWFLITFNTFSGQLFGTLYETRPIYTGLFGGSIWLVSSVSSAFCGWYSMRFRRMKELIVVGFLLFLGALIGLSQLGVGDSYRKAAYGVVVIAGLGLGVQLTLLITLAQLAVPAHLMGIASSHMVMIRSCGASVGVAIASAVYTAKRQAIVPEKIAEYAMAAGVPASSLPSLIGAILGQTASAGVPGLTPEQVSAGHMGALAGYAASFPFVWYTIMPVVIIAIVVMCFTRSVKAEMDWKIDAPVENAEDLGIVEPANRV